MRGFNVKSSLSLLSFLCAALVLIGCAGPVARDLPPVVDRDGEPVTEDGYPVEMLPPLDEELPEEELSPVTPPAPTINPAVTSLTNQARAQYNARNYQAAIATAERGLRIDRRASELYLVLAQSYLQMSMPQQAEQFVQQGLRFAQTGSNVAQSLLRVREIISGGDF